VRKIERINLPLITQFSTRMVYPIVKIKIKRGIIFKQPILNFNDNIFPHFSLDNNNKEIKMER